MDRVQISRGVHLETYRDALGWSIANLSDFWDSLGEFFDVLGDGFDVPALVTKEMPGAGWSPNARLNYAENILRHALPSRLRRDS